MELVLCKALAGGGAAPGAIGSVEECPWAHVPCDPQSFIHSENFKATKKKLEMGCHVDNILVPRGDGASDPIIVTAAIEGDLPVWPPPPDRYCACFVRPNVQMHTMPVCFI